VKLERIVIGIDFSAASVEAARWVACLAPDSEIVLTHVIPIPEPPPIVAGRFARRGLLIDTVREGAEQKLRALGRTLQVEWVWREVREGEPAGCLTRVADEFRADVVVVGAHGERPGLAEGLGSTVEHLVRVSARPVLLVARPRRAAVAHILVAVDKPEGAARTLRSAGEIGQRFGASVMALHVVSPGIVSGVLTAASIVAGTQPIDLSLRRALRESPERWVDRLVDAGLSRERAECEVVVGDATGEIVNVAERVGADLVVMGRRDGGHLRRAVLGSVIDGVLRAAPCPVLVVPEPAPPGARGAQAFDWPLPAVAARSETNSEMFSVVGTPTSA
jgi:nucleotide-binding universal stress UspA family protein